MKIKILSKWFVNGAAFMLLAIGIIFANSTQAKEDASLHVTANDVQDIELDKIEKLLEDVMERFKKEIYQGNVSDVLQVIEKLHKLQLIYPSSQKIDKILFLSGRAKVAMGGLIAVEPYLTPEERTEVDAYYKKHQGDYLIALGVMYKGGDFQTLIENYPNSPLVPEAAFIMATEHLGVGECEADVDCHFSRSINAFLPFIKNYPTHPKIRKAIDNINWDLQRITWNPRENGVWEIFDIEDSTVLLKNYYDAVKKLPSTDIRGEALYPLARAFISVGQYELADRIYSDLEANYPQYHNARTRAAHLMFDYSEQFVSGEILFATQLQQYISRLNDRSENTRLAALDEINHSEIKERPLLFTLLLTIGGLAAKDSSPIVRKKAIDVIGNLASNTSFFRSAVGYCLLYDRDKQNQYYCALQGVQHPDLKNTEFYTYNGERIDSIIIEATGSRAPIDQMIAERRSDLLHEARQSLKEAMDRVAAEGIDLVKFQEDMANTVSQYRVTIFGTEYVIIRKKVRPEVVIPLWAVIMLLSGLLCYRVAGQRNANKKLWTILGVLTAPISLFFVFIIPRRNKR